jgi:hypothetical protein
MLLKTDLEYKLKAIETITDQLIEECTMLQLSYTSTIICDIIYSKASSFVFLFSLSIQNQFKLLYKLMKLTTFSKFLN